MSAPSQSEKLRSLFQTAIAAMDAGDVAGLEQLLREHPDLVRETMPWDETQPADYFTGATLLHHLAGNPNRGGLAANISESAAALLRAGADPNAATLRGSTTIGLILTSKDAAEAQVAPQLIDLLLSAGATDDLDSEETLLLPLRNSAYATAEALQQQGYPTGVRAAAGLGLLSLLRELLEARQNAAGASVAGIDPQEELDQALTYAVTHSHEEAAALLLQYGADINAIPAVYGNPGSALHIAPNARMARFLLAHGADPQLRDPTFNGTPAGWSRYSGNPELAGFFATLTDDGDMGATEEHESIPAAP